MDYIDEKDSIEGAPYLKDEDLPVFDCAFKPAQGERSIAYMAHLKMMAAVQPFLSGAISKTVNVPHEISIEEIGEAYLEGWRMGLKAVAIYRDGSKRSQPLSVIDSSEEEEDKTPASEAPVAAPRRHRLPDTRQSLTHKFNIQGHEGYLTVGLYDDGNPGELFITMAKEGSTIGGLMDAFGTACSLGLQYGVPLKVLVDKFVHSRFEPSGFTQNPDIPMAKSLVDYIFRWLGKQFVPGFGAEAMAVTEKEDKPAEPAGKAEEESASAGATAAEAPAAEKADVEHPIVDLLAADSSAATWLLCALVAVVVAPIIEEFTWPDTGDDEVGPIFFYAGCLDPSLTYLECNLSTVQFYYGPPRNTGASPGLRAGSRNGGEQKE